jgi:hypothetical protein
LASCGSSELIFSNASAGLNGGFELVEDGYPVNWAFGPDPTSNASYQVSLDPDDPVEGQQSLRIETSGTSTKVFRSQRIAIEPGKTYRIAYSVKSEGADLRVRRTTMDFTGTTNKRSDVIGTLPGSTPDWVLQEEIITAAAGEVKVFLTFLVNGVGTLWCDDVRIEEEPSP